MCFPPRSNSIGSLASLLAPDEGMGRGVAGSGRAHPTRRLHEVRRLAPPEADKPYRRTVNGVCLIFPARLTNAAVICFRRTNFQASSPVLAISQSDAVQPPKPRCPPASLVHQGPPRTAWSSHVLRSRHHPPVPVRSPSGLGAQTVRIPEMMDAPRFLGTLSRMGHHDVGAHAPRRPVA